MLALALGAVSPATAAPPSTDETSYDDDGSFVIIDRAAWLYAAPEPDAARLRPTTLDAAPEHRASPSVVLLRRGPASGGFVPVRVPSFEAPPDPIHGAAPPDVAPSSWAHCYVQPPVFAQAGFDLWVRADDLLPVLTRDVETTLADGTRIQLARGLSVTGSRGQYRVRGMHVDVVVASLPRDALGRAYNRTEPPAQRDLIGEQTGQGSFKAQPTWGALLDGRDDAMTLKRNPSTDGETVDVLRDRCIRVAFPSPVGPVPRVDESALRAPATYPIWAATGAAMTLEQGAVIGHTGAPLVLWSRRDCDWSATKGLCCQPLAGVELQGTSEAICLDTAMPEQGAARDLSKVLQDRARRMTFKLQTASTLEATVSVGDIEVRGVLTEGDVRSVLSEEAEAFRYCYERRLGHDPTLAGAVELRFAVAPDAHVRDVTVVKDEMNEPMITDCVAQRLEIPAFVPQAGQSPSFVEATLHFRTAPRPTD